MTRYLLKHSNPPTNTTMPTKTATATMMNKEEAETKKRIDV